MTGLVGAIERLARRLQITHSEANLADEVVREPDPDHQSKSLKLRTA